MNKSFEMDFFLAWRKVSEKALPFSSPLPLLSFHLLPQPLLCSTASPVLVDPLQRRLLARHVVNYLFLFRPPPRLPKTGCGRLRAAPRGKRITATCRFVVKHFSMMSYRSSFTIGRFAVINGFPTEDINHTLVCVCVCVCLPAALVRWVIMVEARK